MNLNEYLLLTPTLSMLINKLEDNGSWVSFRNKEGNITNAYINYSARVINSIESKESIDTTISMLQLIKNNQEEVFEFFNDNSSELKRLERVSLLDRIG